MLDPRDQLLQAHTPALMVPRYLPRGHVMPWELDRSGHRYLIAEDGLWIEVTRPWLLARVPLEHPSGVKLPYGRLSREILYRGIRADDYEEVKRRLLIDARAALPREFAAAAIFDDRTKRLTYRPLVALEASAGGITYARPRLEPHEHLVLDMHSHGAMSAFFSRTDDEDDAGEVKVAMVVGNVDRAEGPTWCARLCLPGIFVEDTDEVDDEEASNDA